MKWKRAVNLIKSALEDTFNRLCLCYLDSPALTFFISRYLCVCQRGRKNPHGCVIQSPLYWLILWACGILLLILYLFWLLFSKYRQLVKSLRVPFKTGGIRPNEASTLWGMHTRICLRSTICICYCCHIYFVSFIKIYRLLLRPFVFWANICSVIPRHFLSASNQKSCERPRLRTDETHKHWAHFKS